MRKTAVTMCVLSVVVAVAVAILWVVRRPAGEPTEPLKLEYPKAHFVGTPKNITRANLEAARGDRPAPPMMVPSGLTNVALGRPVTSSDGEPIIGELSMVTDGSAEAEEGSFVEVSPGPQWVQIDLGKTHVIYAIAVWHFHREARIYRDVIVQVADDPVFEKDVKTVYNADHDNSSKLGKGSDKEYFETNQGRLINAKGARGRYVRLYSNGSANGVMNHYIEVKAFGRQEPVR